jgi:hypothetical protein
LKNKNIEKFELNDIKINENDEDDDENKFLMKKLLNN